ncbi:MAG TPA: alpha/beta hydrolase [Pseudomonadales bacterium]|nr:alpha/beta hydrolase [Pseudomonadales bacterium]
MNNSQQILDQIRAEFRAIKQEKRGLEGNRKFMDSGWENAEYPPDTHFVPFDADGIHAETVFLGTNSEDKKIILHCHGGGYAVGSTLSHRPLAAQLANACNVRTITFNFRLAPENKFPCALDDALTVYRFLLKSIRSENIIISGDSGGASLAFALALQIRDLGLPAPAALLGLSAWLDFACEGNTFEINKPKDPSGNRGGLLMMATSYAGKDNLKNPLVSPLYAESLADLPPILLQVGTAETLLDDSRRFAEKARTHGADVTLQEWPDMIHVWHAFYSRLQESRDAIAAISDWLQEKKIITTTSRE